MMLFLVPTFFFGIYDKFLSSVTPRYTVPADVELFAPFTIPQVEATDLRPCRIRAGLVCGVGLVLRQSD